MYVKCKHIMLLVRRKIPRRSFQHWEGWGGKHLWIFFILQSIQISMDWWCTHPPSITRTGADLKDNEWRIRRSRSAVTEDDVKSINCQKNSLVGKQGSGASSYPKMLLRPWSILEDKNTEGCFLALCFVACNYILCRKKQKKKKTTSAATESWNKILVSPKIRSSKLKFLIPPLREATLERLLK